MSNTTDRNFRVRRLEESADNEQRTADAYREVVGAMVEAWGHLTGLAAEILGDEIRKMLEQVNEYDRSARIDREVAAAMRENSR